MPPRLSPCSLGCLVDKQSGRIQKWIYFPPFPLVLWEVLPPTQACVLEDDSPNAVTHGHQHLVNHESVWFYFPLASHPHLPNFTTVLFNSNCCKGFLFCQAATSPPVHSLHCNQKDPSRIKRSVNAVRLLETPGKLPHWVQGRLQTSSCYLHPKFFSSLNTWHVVFILSANVYWMKEISLWGGVTRGD